MTAVSPLSGPLDAPTRLHVAATNVAPTPGLACAFEGAVRQTAPASFAGEGALVCDAPPLPEGHRAPAAVAVVASTDGSAFGVGSAPYVYYDAAAPPSLTAVAPRLLALDAPATLTLSGANIAPTGSLLLCRFAAVADGERASLTTTTAPASYVDPGTARCAPPPADGPATLLVSLSLDGGDAGRARRRLHSLRRARAAVGVGRASRRVGDRRRRARRRPREQLCADRRAFRARLATRRRRRRRRCGRRWRDAARPLSHRQEPSAYGSPSAAAAA